MYVSLSTFNFQLGGIFTRVNSMHAGLMNKIEYTGQWHFPRLCSLTELPVARDVNERSLKTALRRWNQRPRRNSQCEGIPLASVRRYGVFRALERQGNQPTF